MALETIVFPQDLFNYGYRDLYSLAADWNFEFEDKNLECGSTGSVFHSGRQLPSATTNGGLGNWDSVTKERCGINPSSAGGGSFPAVLPAQPITATPVRRKRRRTRSCKNKEEMENQRMAHIAVERNRRKQMNEYLAVLRSMMPPSYIQRGDQASIIGGAINFVKELEQRLQSLEAHKRIKQQSTTGFSSPFADFFTFPQYSTCLTPSISANETAAANHSAIADIEVTMVESHANLKVLSRKRPRQLLKMVAQFQNLHLTILHLNITTIDTMVLYSFSAKVEDDCQLTSVDEIATAVHQMLGRIHEEADLN